METVSIVLNIRNEDVDTFEAGFRKHEVPVWADLRDRGLLERATLNRLDISTHPVEGATQYLIAVIFTSDEGHHVHDHHPGFEAWNEIADAYQIASPLVFHGVTVEGISR